MTDFEIDMLLEDIESGEIINKNKRDAVRIKSLQDGGTYVVRFNKCLTPSQSSQWLKVLRKTLIGRNIVLIPELPQFFEIVGESIEKNK